MEARILLTLTDRQPAELLLQPILNDRLREIKSLLRSPQAVADAQAAPFSSAQWQSLNLLRLEEGDAGHELWARHRTLYVAKVKEARELWSVELGGAPTGLELCPMPWVGGYGGQL